MNKSILAAALTTCVALASSNAMAADGKITFTGTVDATTCVINGGDTGSTPDNIQVSMGSIGKSSITDAGSPYLSTDFTLTMQGGAGCIHSGKAGQVTLEAGDLTSDGDIKNSGDAAGVVVRLSQNGTRLNMHSDRIVFPPSGGNGDESTVVNAALIAPVIADVGEGTIEAIGNYTVSFN